MAKFIKKLKKVFKSGSFWLVEIALAGLILGIPFFISGKSFIEFLSQYDFKAIMIFVIGTVGLGLFIEMYIKKIFK